jgi:hypothetical protein
MIDDYRIINTLTVRGRSAYYLAIAESIFSVIARTDPGFSFARDALDKAWQWVGGVQIAADDLYQYLENERDTGLMVFSWNARTDQTKSAAWNTIVTAIMYLAWEAYKIEGASYLPQTIESVDETIATDLRKHAERSGRLDSAFVGRLQDYLSKRHSSSTSNELGSPIFRDELMTLLR